MLALIRHITNIGNNVKSRLDSDESTSRLHLIQVTQSGFWGCSYHQSQVELKHLCGFMWSFNACQKQCRRARAPHCLECEDPADEFRAPRTGRHNAVYAAAVAAAPLIV